MSTAAEGGTFGPARVLVVSQQYQVHQEIAKLLEDVRKVAVKAAPDQKPPLRERSKVQSRWDGMPWTPPPAFGHPAVPFPDSSVSPPAPPKK